RCPPPVTSSASSTSPDSTTCLSPLRVSNWSVPLSVSTYWRCGALCHSKLEPAAVSSKLMDCALSVPESAFGPSSLCQAISPTAKRDWPSSPVNSRISRMTMALVPCAMHANEGVRRDQCEGQHLVAPITRGLQRRRPGSQWIAAKELRDGCPHQPLSRGLCSLAARPAGLLGRGGAGHRLDRAAEAGVRSRCRSVWPLVRRRCLQHLLERGRSPRDARPRRAGGHHLRFPPSRREARDHLPPPAGRNPGARRNPAQFRCGQGRPRRP